MAKRVNNGTHAQDVDPDKDISPYSDQVGWATNGVPMIESKPRTYECCTCECPGTATHPLYNCHGCPHIGHIGCLGDSLPLWTCEHCEDIPTSTDSGNEQERPHDDPARLRECERCCMPTSNQRCIYCNDLTCERCRSQGYNRCCTDPSDPSGNISPYSDQVGWATNRPVARFCQCWRGCVWRVDAPNSTYCCFCGSKGCYCECLGCERESHGALLVRWLQLQLQCVAALFGRSS